MTIIEQLKQFKKDKNISMYKIAKDLDIPYQTVYFWFTKGIRPIRPYQEIILKYIMSDYVKRND